MSKSDWLNERAVEWSARLSAARIFAERKLNAVYSFFYARRVAFVQPGIIFGVAMIAMLWFSIDSQMQSEIKVARSGAEQDVKNFARVFEEHVARTIKELDKALLIARKEYRTALSKYKYEDAIREPLPDPDLLSDMSFQLAMVDRDGFLVATTIGKEPPKAINLSDRSHFRIHQTQRPDTPHISPPVLGRRSGRWSVQLTRRVAGPENRFDGVVVASMDPDQFARFYGSIDLGHKGIVVLSGFDGIVRATSGSSALKLGSNVGETDIFDNGRVRVGVHKGDMDGSGRNYLFSTRQIPDLPLFVSVGVPLLDVAEATFINRVRYVLVGFSVTLAIIIAMYASVRYHLRLSREQTRASKNEARAQRKSRELELTLNNMGQGIIMVDQNRKLAVYNRKATKLMGLTDEDVKETENFDSLISKLWSRGEFKPASNASAETIILRERALGGTDFVRQFERVRPDGTVLDIRSKKLIDGGFVRTLTNITDRRKAEQKIVHLARHDPLTNLANRAVFREQLDRALRCLPENGGFGVLFVDLDDFKSINDTRGHPFGDELLKNVAKRLTSSIRKHDIVARLGGDEFAIIQHGISNAKEAHASAQRLVALLKNPHMIDGQQTFVTASVGYAIAPRDSDCPDELLKNADIALYQAKAAGRATYRLFEPDMVQKMLERKALEKDLADAITNRELQLYYQPIVTSQTGRITRFEALLRWNHPERGFISPADFVPVAEDTGLILPIGEWVLEEACRQINKWGNDVRIAVNLSPQQFHEQKLVQIVQRILKETELRPDRLSLEITESTLLRNGEATTSRLRRLKDIGIEIAMDDFGTGYSSLSYLRNFPFDKIKIDQSFVKELGDGADRDAIVGAIISLADCLDLQTTAEGVETVEQLRTLQGMGCGEIQGYLISKPLPALEAEALLDKTFDICCVPDRAQNEDRLQRRGKRQFAHKKAKAV